MQEAAFLGGGLDDGDHTTDSVTGDEHTKTTVC